MSKFATGKYAKAISDRSGLAFPYQEMLREWNGSFVHKSEYEAKAPQVQPTPHKGDAQALRNVRTDRDETAVPQLLGINPFTTGCKFKQCNNCYREKPWQINRRHCKV